MEKELSEQWKRFTLFISNEDMNDIIKIIKLFGCINRKGYRNSKTQNKKKEGRFLGALLAPLAAQLVRLVISSVVKGVRGRGVRRAGRRYMDENF